MPKKPKVKKNHIEVKYSKDLERQRLLQQRRLLEPESQLEPAGEADIIDSVAYEAWEDPEPRRLPSGTGTRTVGRNIL